MGGCRCWNCSLASEVEESSSRWEGRNQSLEDGWTETGGHCVMSMDGEGAGAGLDSGLVMVGFGGLGGVGVGVDGGETDTDILD